jgi:hypothetical protein
MCTQRNAIHVFEAASDLTELHEIPREPAERSGYWFRQREAWGTTPV